MSSLHQESILNAAFYDLLVTNVGDQATGHINNTQRARARHGLLKMLQKNYEGQRCGAKTRRGTPCKRKALKNGRCPNHGGLSTGLKFDEGRQRITEAQRKRWKRWQAEAK